jgi:hypothetical protein
MESEMGPESVEGESMKLMISDFMCGRST